MTSCQEDKRPGTPELSDLVRNITDQLPNLSLPESWSQIQPQPQPQSTVATEAAASPQLSNVYTHAVSSDPSPSSHSAIGSALPPTSLLDPAVPTQLDPDGSPSADRIPKPQPGLAASPSDTSQLNSDLMQRDAVAGAQSVDREVDGTGADEDGADGNGADEDGAVGTDADEDGADGDCADVAEGADGKGAGGWDADEGFTCPLALDPDELDAELDAELDEALGREGRW